MAFILVAALAALGAMAEATAPGRSFSCSGERGCRRSVDPVALLPEGEQAAVRASPAASARFLAYVARLPVRAGLAGLALTDEGLLAFLFMAVGLTLRRLGSRSGHVLARALPWLKRGAFAGLLWAVAHPVTGSLRAMLLFPGTPGGASWYFGLDLTVAGPALLLAIAAYATAWALEAGVRAQRDLADFV